jgi:hypothetical protein
MNRNKQNTARQTQVVPRLGWFQGMHCARLHVNKRKKGDFTVIYWRVSQWDCIKVDETDVRQEPPVCTWSAREGKSVRGESG